MKKLGDVDRSMLICDVITKIEVSIDIKEYNQLIEIAKAAQRMERESIEEYGQNGVATIMVDSKVWLKITEELSNYDPEGTKLK